MRLSKLLQTTLHSIVSFWAIPMRIQSCLPLLYVTVVAGHVWHADLCFLYLYYSDRHIIVISGKPPHHILFLQHMSS